MNGGMVKTFFIFSTTMFFLMGVVMASEACCSEGAKMVVLKVEGMTCASCNVAVNIALRKLDGVVEATASYRLGRAEVEYVPEKVTPKQMIEAINKLGKYKAGIYKAKGGHKR